jgi:hypothetical protein
MPPKSKFVADMASASDNESSGDEGEANQSDLDFIAPEESDEEYGRHALLLARMRMSSDEERPHRKRPRLRIRSLPREEDIPTVPLGPEPVPDVPMSPLVLAVEPEEKKDLSDEQLAAAEAAENEKSIDYAAQNYPRTCFCLTVGFGAGATLEHVMNQKVLFEAKQAEFIKEIAKKKVTYIVWQLEKGGKTGFHHLQMYMSVKGGQRFTWPKKLVKDWFPGVVSTFVGARKGTVSEAAEYCEKDDTRVVGPDGEALWSFSWGEKPLNKQGKRSDIETVVSRINEGANMEDLRREFPGTMSRIERFCGNLISDRDKNVAMKQTAERNERRVARLAALKVRVEAGEITLEEAKEINNATVDPGDRQWWVFWGTSGGGKTHAATTRCGERPYTIENMRKVTVYTIGEDFANNLFPDSDTLFIDEMDKATTRTDSVNPRQILSFSDTHVSFQKQKGCAPYVYKHTHLITAGNAHPRKWIVQTEEMLRRITRVYKFTMTAVDAYFKGCEPWECTIVTDAMRKKWLEEAEEARRVAQPYGGQRLD